MTNPMDQMDAYLLGQLDDQAKAAFEAAVARDPALAEELEFRREMKAGLAAAQAEDIRARVRNFGTEAPRTGGTHWYYWAAASVVLLACMSWWFWPAPSLPAGQDLFVAYYQPTVQLDQPRNQGGPTLIDTLVECQETKNFTFIAERLDRLPDSAKSRPLQLLEAVALIELMEEAKALALLEALREAPQPEFANEANWLIALLQIRAEDFPAAAAILETIAADTSQGHHQEAAEVLLKVGDRARG